MPEPGTTYSTPLGVGWSRLLLEVPGLLELLGDRGAAGVPVYPLVAPPDARFPFLVWQVVSTVHQEHLDGPSALARARVQLKAYALTYEEAAALAELLRKELHANRHGVVGGLNVRRLALLDQVEDYEPPTDATEAGAFSVRQDWELWYGVALP